MYDLIAILGGYLLGSIPFALLITRLFGVRNLRLVGSGNIGATNAWRVAGPAAGILVAVFDIGKGVLAVFLAASMPEAAIGMEYLKLISGPAAVLGHIFPVFLLFKGGKGVNTALGVMITLLPLEVLIALVVFIVAVAVSRLISLGSISASAAFFLAVLIEWLFDLRAVHPVYVLASFFIMVLIITAHRSNMRRLLAGTERKFSLHTKNTGEVNSNA